MKTILIVDDDKALLELIGFVLKKNHYRTLAASNAQEAFLTLEKQLPDLIVLDVLLPGMKGIELCERLKAAPSTKDVPVLFLSALAGEKEAETGLRAGAEGYIFKPFNADQLLKKIETILSKTGGK